MVSRALYLVFYILYLVVLAIGLWFLLYYSQVPLWVWFLFSGPILIAIIGAILKEFFLTRTITTCGSDSDHYTFWAILYVILHLIAFGVLITGIVFAINYSNILWWVWVVLGVAVILSILAEMLITFDLRFITLLLAIGAFITFVVSLIFLIIYSNAPWWIWLIIGLAVFFAFLSFIFQIISDKNEVQYITHTIQLCY